MRHHELRFVHVLLSFSRSFVWDTSKCGAGNLIRAFGARRRPVLLTGNGTGGLSGVSWGGLRLVRRFLRASVHAPGYVPPRHTGGAIPGLASLERFDVIRCPKARRTLEGDEAADLGPAGNNAGNNKY